MPAELCGYNSKTGKWIKRYKWPAVYVTPQDGIAEALRDWRREATQDREIFLGYQKSFARDDREVAKFFKEQAGVELRLQRACTFMIPWFGSPDNNQTVVRPALWPVDMAAELDEISYRIIMQFG